MYRRRHFTWPSPSPGSYMLLPSSSSVFLRFNEKEIDIDVLLGTKQSSLLFSVLKLVMYLFIRKKFLCLRLKATQVYEHRHKYLKGNGTQWPVMKIQTVGPTLPQKGISTQMRVRRGNGGGYRHVSLCTCVKLSKIKRIIIIIYEYWSSNLNVIIPLIENSQE